MAIERIDPELCIGCKLCFNTCYGDVIRMDEMTKKAVVQYPQDCVLCYWCFALCPKDAISISPVKTSPVFTSWG